MEEKKLIVKNFFTLKEIDIDLSQFNIFIGEQASGKSLLVKLIYYFNENFNKPIFQRKENLRTIKKNLLDNFNKIFHIYLKPLETEEV